MCKFRKVFTLLYLLGGTFQAAYAMDPPQVKTRHFPIHLSFASCNRPAK